MGRDVPSLSLDTPSQAEATITDGSNQLFSLYNEAAATHDRKVAERWESDADSAVLVVRYQFPDHLVIVVPNYYRMAFFQSWLQYYSRGHTTA